MNKIITLILIVSAFNSFAQNNCPCCDITHNQFDFWIGKWTVFDTLGNKVGDNEISKIEYNCGLVEHWSGSSGGTGTSLNYFDKTDSTWNQVWVDNSGNVLKLKGKYVAGKMILKSDLLSGKNSVLYYNQVTWTLQEDGSVIQLWEAYNKEEKLLSTIFKGIYKPKTENQEKYGGLVKEAWKFYQAKKYQESANKYQEAFEQLNGKSYPNDRYNAACSYALAGDIDNSFYHLFKLAENPKIKYKNYTHISTDSDLEILQKDKRWNKLMAIVKSNK